MKTIIKQHKFAALVIGLMVLSIFLSYFFSGYLPELIDRNALSAFVDQFGYWGPLAIVGIVAIEVIIAPLPGGAPPIIVGALFGPIGILYVWLGNMIGSAIAFLIARHFGIKIVKKFAPRYDAKKSGKQLHALWALYFIPLMPVDILSFAFGLSHVSFKKFILITSLGFGFSMTLLTLYGDVIVRFIS